MRCEERKFSPKDITPRLASVEAPSSSKKKEEHCGVPERSLGMGLPPPEEQRGPAPARPGNGLRGAPPRAAICRGPEPGRKGSAR